MSPGWNAWGGIPFDQLPLFITQLDQMGIAPELIKTAGPGPDGLFMLLFYVRP